MRAHCRSAGKHLSWLLMLSLTVLPADLGRPALQSLAALSTIASRTGCTSVGDRLMIPSTSAVAV